MFDANDRPGTNTRIVAVMNFLASHPAESFTLTEIAENVGLSVGTAHRLLTALAEERFLSRHPKHKTYSLGLALVAIGQAALVQHRALDVAKREMVRLVDDLKVQCVATTVVNQDMLVLACEGAAYSTEPSIYVGERRPHIPPLGMSYVAWGSQAARDEYLSRAPSALGDRAYSFLTTAIEAIRDRGWNLVGSGPAIRALRHFGNSAPGTLRDESYWRGVMQLMSDLSEDEIQIIDADKMPRDGILCMGAPVFDSDGTVTLELSVSGLAPGLLAGDVRACLDRLSAAAASVTKEIRGISPMMRGIRSALPSKGWS